MNENDARAVRPGYQQSKRNVLIAVAVLSVAIAPVAQLVGQDPGSERLLNIISVFGYGILMFAWCYYDGLERNRPLTPRFRLLIVVLGTPVLFFHLFRTRGFRPGLKASGLAVLVYFGSILLTAFSYFLTALVATGR
ncbi:MAG: hypothetical protein ABIP75_11850 [Pyrinomonadaceae bacterium]